MKKHNIQILCFLLIVLMLFATACGKKGSKSNLPENHILFDVISSIDPATIESDGDTLRFTAVSPDGLSIRFEGTGVTYEENSLRFTPGGMLFSLDYVGEIKEVRVQNNINSGSIDYGFALANQPSASSMKDLSAGICMSINAEREEQQIGTDGAYMDFLILSFSLFDPATEYAQLSGLNLLIDTAAPQKIVSEFLENEDFAFLYENYQINWNNTEIVSEHYDYEQLAMDKLQDPNVIQSDIIAGIDRSSIQTTDDITTFSSTMSDGSVVRFEGSGIRITDSGILFTPSATLTSLDALGAIYGFIPIVENRETPAAENDVLNAGYGYTYSAAKTAVSSAAEVHTYPSHGDLSSIYDGTRILSTVTFEPNFAFIQASGYNTDDILISSLTACYDPARKATAVTEAAFDLDFTGAYISGDRYNAGLEEGAGLNFYLILKPDTPYADMSHTGGSMWYVPDTFYEVGALRDASGKELDKTTATITPGCTLDLTVGDYPLTLPLNTVEQYFGAQTMNDLVPYAFPSAVGNMNTLVIPIIWADQTNMANDDTLELFRQRIGRIADAQGKVTDYSVDSEGFSLSSYFDNASYGNLKITSFLTDWYFSPQNFTDTEFYAPNTDDGNALLEWVKATYPDLDWSKYDQDGNGYVDSMILLNAGVSQTDGYSVMSYGGAFNWRSSYYGDYAGTQASPLANVFSVIGYRLIKDNASTLVHEFSHGLGIIDYYDVNYSGIDAVGKFDMQSGSYGDWNAYSKLTMGWMNPQVVSGLKSGQSVELTIGSSAVTDDVIVIPAAGKEYGGPFGEYVMIDLFTDEGNNKYDVSRDAFDLKDTAGVRISHVNGTMEKRTNTIPFAANPAESAAYTIGTIHFANNFKADGMGRYNIEVIQSGGKNTFAPEDHQNGGNVLSKKDFFYEGDTFDATEYVEFFYEGKMDDGSEFGYTVEVVSINKDANGQSTATLRVTAK